MARYMAIYTWNGSMTAHFEDSYARLSVLIDEAIKEGVQTVQVYTLAHYNVYEYLFTIRARR